MGCLISGPTVDDINPAYLKDPKTMRIMVYSLLWVMQGLCHQPYLPIPIRFGVGSLLTIIHRIRYLNTKPSNQQQPKENLTFLTISPLLGALGCDALGCEGSD